MKNLVVIENVRSSYNTGNIIRTADALGWGVVISGYTPDPEEVDKVAKTALGAEEHTIVYRDWNTHAVLDWLEQGGYCIIAAECTDSSISVMDHAASMNTCSKPYALVMGNEKTGVLDETLDRADAIYHIPMQGIKESLNVGQAAAIMMWELGKAHGAI